MTPGKVYCHSALNEDMLSESGMNSIKHIQGSALTVSTRLRIRCDVPGSTRKASANAVGEAVGTYPAYKAAPTFASIIGNYPLDCNGIRTCDPAGLRLKKPQTPQTAPKCIKTSESVIDHATPFHATAPCRSMKGCCFHSAATLPIFAHIVHFVYSGRLPLILGTNTPTNRPEFILVNDYNRPEYRNFPLIYRRFILYLSTIYRYTRDE